MRSHCSECGHATNKGLPVCAYCGTGRTRLLHPCEDCGDPVEVRKVPGGQYRCATCRNQRVVATMLGTAKPILERGGTLAEVARELGLSAERVRQILSSHQELRTLRRKSPEERHASVLGEQLSAGLSLEEAARVCGLAQAAARGIVARHAGLRALAISSREQRLARLRVERFDRVFRLVEVEGLSIGAACRTLGIRCRMLIYEVARTPEALERYPKLREVPRRRRLPLLEFAARREGLQSAG